jgi:cytochrome c5
MSNHDDAVFVRNFSMVLVGLCVVGILAFILAKVVNRSAQENMTPSSTVASRVSPIGQINTSGTAVVVAGTAASPAPGGANAAPAAPEAPAASGDIGKATYDKACFACHAQGIAGAPKHADMAAWEPRLEQGVATLYDHAINGYTGSAGMMPARGGNPTLSDAEVQAAVDYMLAAVGRGNQATAPAAEAPAAEPAPEAPAAPASETPAADAAASDVPVADNARGKEVYDAACFVCHTPGAAGAPKLGDATAWGTRLEKGLDVLYHNSINGFMGTAGMMPPKGGRPDFSDDDVKAAVDYMVSNAQ